MRNGEDEHPATRHVFGAPEHLQPATVGQNAPPIADDQVAPDPPLEGPDHPDRRLCFGKSARALERIHAKDDALDDDRRAGSKLLVGERKKSGRRKFRCQREEREESEDPGKSRSDRIAVGVNHQ
jgi:hypothetical protein